jgi:hypothetical protein
MIIVSRALSVRLFHIARFLNKPTTVYTCPKELAQKPPVLVSSRLKKRIKKTETWLLPLHQKRLAEYRINHGSRRERGTPNIRPKPCSIIHVVGTVCARPKRGIPKNQNVCVDRRGSRKNNPVPTDLAV